ncbi:MAG TPA: 4'-phosphopantetheinyl transferase superfamily protein [Gemmatimonadaceae bacterium]|nr:4'-phosphopantetheinyl transferase superfamily protein [Gemmatimonadaceae bacterium]
MGVADRCLHTAALASVAVARVRPGPAADRAAAGRALRAAIRALVGGRPAMAARVRPGGPRQVRIAGGPAVRVSVAHREGRAAAAVTASRARVGVDIERGDAVAGAHVRYFLTEAERRSLDRRSPAEMWALKEAAWKALALDATVPFHALELELDADGALQAVTSGGVRHEATAALGVPWHGWVLAVVRIQSEGICR